MFATLTFLTHMALATSHSATVRLDALDPSLVCQGWAKPMVSESVSRTPKFIVGVAFKRENGTVTPGWTGGALDINTTKIRSSVGVDGRSEGASSRELRVVTDSPLAFNGGVIRGGDDARPVEWPLDSRRERHLLTIDVENARANDSEFWGNSSIEDKSKA